MNKRAVLVCVVLCCGLAVGESVKWSFPLDAPSSAPTLFPNETAPTGLVITAGTAVIRLKGDGSMVWRSDQPVRVATPATVADIDGDGVIEILFALADGSVVCLDETGKARWTHPFNTPVGDFKMLVAADLTPHHGMEILAGFDDGWLNCLSAKGDLIWRFFGDKFRVGGIAVGCVDGDNIPEILYGTDDGHVYCLDTFGRVEWRYSERAPYGRSGVNLADLHGDGKPAALITRSNVGNATCLMALDGKTGSFLWRTQDVMQGYFSNAVVDYEGDGVWEVLHGDKANHLYCENADGARRWDVELGGRGMFWAPAVADVDGDGQLEAVAGLRSGDPKTGTSVYVVGADGKVKQALKLGGGANASPAVGDIDGDGVLEVVVVTEGPNQVQAITWNAPGRVAWASGRGNSRMTANGNVPLGGPTEPGAASAPHAIEDLTPVGEMQIETGDMVWGENLWNISWKDPAPENSFLEVAVIVAGGQDETRIVNLATGATHAQAPVRLVQETAANVAIHLHTTSSAVPAASAMREAVPQPPEFCRFEQVAAICQRAIEAGAERAQGLRTRLSLLHAEQDTVRALVASSAPAAQVTEAAGDLRDRAAMLERLAAMLDSYWRAGGSGDFVWWQDANPWDAFEPASVPDKLEVTTPATIKAFGNEFEDVALTLRNLTADPIDVRCTFANPDANQPRPIEPELAKHVTLRHAVPVASVQQPRVFDALPELDLSRAITLPPDEARQLWLVIDTHGLKPGVHELTLYLGTLSKPPTVRQVPLRIEVWPVELPTDVFAKMNWSNFNLNEASDQAVRDMIDHGLSVLYGPPLPQIPVDAEGHRAGDVDWKVFDQTLARIPRHFTMLWSGPPACKWPNGAAPGEDTPAYTAGFQTGIQELAAHLAAKGIGYHQWAFYPIDEPWNTGFTEIPHLKRFCEQVKHADPKVQNYADCAGLVRVEYLEPFKDLIDIWQPEMNLLKRDPKLVEWFKTHAKRFWAYEAPGPAKDLLPLGHYRAFSWLALKFGLEGAGYWVYRGEDNWWGRNNTDYSAVYQTGDQVIPSRRWEADRDGVEDYRAVHVLRQAIAEARAAGRAAEADQAQALIDEAIEALVGWQIKSIDEITRMTRDYEIDFARLLEYRGRVAEAIVKLRAHP